MTVAFWRPIEITDDNNFFDVGLGGGEVVTLTNGVYAMLPSLLFEIRLQIRALGANYASCDVYLNASNKVVIDNSSGIDIDLYFYVGANKSSLWSILGFVGSDSGANEYIADYTPSHCWFPTYQPYDGMTFRTISKDNFYGSTAIDGSISGVSPGSPLYKRDFKFAVEDASNVYIGRNEDTTTDTVTTAYWQAERSYEQLTEQARLVTLSGAVADHYNCSAKGCYYIDCVEDWQGETPTIALAATYGAGGIMFDTADTYVFGQVPLAGGGSPGLQNSKNQSYIGPIDLTITTSAIPAAGWSAP